MSSTQVWISALAMLAAALGLIIFGALVHNDTILGAGLGLLPAAGAALGIPRPKDI